MGKSWRGFEDGRRTEYVLYPATPCIELCMECLCEDIAERAEDEGICDCIVISSAECFVIYDNGFVQQMRMANDDA